VSAASMGAERGRSPVKLTICLVAAAEGARKGKRGAGGKFHGGCASPAKARAREKKHQNSRAGLRRMQRRGICFQCAELYSLCWRRIQRARSKKSVILALRYFSATAGDALSSDI
jgi:hypothetical protein